jgi:hypothetical protein
MKAKATIFMLCVIILSCRKGNSPDITLNGKLTDCSANSTCTYSYFDNAEINSTHQIISGNFRVFCYKSVNVNLCGATSEFFVKTALGDSEFDITSSQIAAGQVFANDFSCPCCENALLFTPIGGEIKGKRTDATHWLVNATIIFGTSPTTPVDTLVINQYFSQQKLQ